MTLLLALAILLLIAVLSVSIIWMLEQEWRWQREKRELETKSDNQKGLTLRDLLTLSESILEEKASEMLTTVEVYERLHAQGWPVSLEEVTRVVPVIRGDKIAFLRHSRFTTF